MDPLTALGLAASVVQFVQFAASLLSETRKIYNSSSGASEDTERLEFIHGSLSDLCSKLEAGSGRKAQGVRFVASGLPKDAPSLADLALRCQEDCRKLLEVVDRMKVKARSGWKIWSSFRMAMTEVLKANEIERLQERIEKYQRLMVLHLCSVSSGVIESTEAQVRALRFEMRSLHNQRSQQLHQISQDIHGIQGTIEEFRVDQGKTFFSPEEVESLTTKVSQLSLSGEELAKEHGLLQSLNYKQRPARHENIATAHQATLSWIFSDNGAKSTETANLIEWLATGQGVFWVSGKPGSGKSTLMKFLVDHPSTDRLLSTWACSVPVIKACHFFWSPGTDIQRSQEGLLRSLLYDILSQNPDLIRLTCPEIWSRMKSAQASASTPWSLSELESTIQRISQSQLPFKFCFFIDGLDEFSGNHLQLCESLVGLSQCPGIKLLVSSRPWNDFEESFGSNPGKKLYVHQLTSGDIQRYTESRLVEHSNWKSLMLNAGDQHAMSLIDEISSRSRGVFLWVFLVTTMLRQGLTNYDTLSELQKRLREIPTDLGKFFRVILESVEPFYHAKMAGTMLLALAAKEPLPVAIYSFHDREYENPDYALKEEAKAWSKETFEAFQRPLARRLSSRCKGLLEIQGRNVEFLHRTVRDFFRTAEMNDFLVKKAPGNFDASLSITMAYAAWIKHKSFYGSPSAIEGSSEHFVSVLDHLLLYANGEVVDKSATIYDILDDMEWFLNQIFKGRTGEDVHGRCLPSKASLVFRQRVVRANLVGYVAAKLDDDGAYLNGQETPPLAVVFGFERAHSIPMGGDQAWSDKVNLLRSLLRNGQGPNQPYPWSNGSFKKSPWTDLMQEHFKVGTASRTASLLNAGVISLLLDYGADANAFTHFDEWDTLRQEQMSLKKAKPIWIKFVLASLLSNNGKSFMADCKDAYLEALGKMLSKADFDAPAEWLDESCKSFNLLQPISAAEGTIVTARSALFYIIASRLRQLPAHQKPSYLYFQFLAKTIEAFMEQAVHPLAPVDEMQSAIREAFPSNLSAPLVGVIWRLYLDRGSSITSRKRNRSIVEDYRGVCEDSKTGKRVCRHSDKGGGTRS